MTAGIAGPAEAATVSLEEAGPYAELRFTDRVGEDNDVRVERAGPKRFVVTDEGGSLRAGRGCTADPTDPTDPARVSCETESEILGEFADFELGEGDDRLVIGSWQGKGNVHIPIYEIPTFDLGPGDDRYMGIAGEDRVIPGPGRDRVDSGAGNDLVEAGEVEDGNDVLNGGPGLDSISYRKRETPVVIDLKRDRAGGDEEVDGIIRFEDAFGGGGDDRILGTGGRNLIFAGPGGDSVFAGGGEDAVIGGSGRDSIDGGGGNDHLFSGHGGDLLLGGGGDDILFGDDDGLDLLRCGSGRDGAVASKRDRHSDCEKVGDDFRDILGIEPLKTAAGSWR